MKCPREYCKGVLHFEKEVYSSKYVCILCGRSFYETDKTILDIPEKFKKRENVQTR